MAKSYNSIKAGWVNKNADSVGKRKSYKDIKTSDYDFGVDTSYVNSFLDDSRSYLQQSGKDAGNVNYKNASSEYDSKRSQWSSLRDRANTVRAFYNVSKANMSEESYNQMMEYLDAFDRGSSDVLNYYRDNKKYFSQFKTEDDYNKYVKDNEWGKKYKGKTYAELSSVINSEDVSGDEKSWVQNYMTTDRTVIDSMTVDEVKAAKDRNESKRKELEAKRERLRQEKFGWQRSRTNAKRVKEIDKELKRLDEQIKESKAGVLYYDGEKGAVTYDTLYSVKNTENTIANMQSDTAANGLYNSLQTYDEELPMFTALDAMVVDGTISPDGIKAESEEQQKVLDYFSQKYGFDFKGNPYDLKKEVDELGTRLRNKYNSEKKQLGGLGYNYDDIVHYNNWKEDRENYEAKQKASQDFASESFATGALTTVFNIITAPMQGVEYLGNVIPAIGAEEGSPRRLINIYDDTFTNIAEATSSSNAESINDWVKDKTGQDWLAWLASNGYSGVTSSIQSAVQAAAFGPETALVIMGSEAANSALHSAVQNGSTAEEAIATSMAAGVFEGLFEKFSIDNLDKIKSLTKSKAWDASSFGNLLKSFAKNSGSVAMQGLVEASEEGATEIFNRLADELINGDHSQYNTDVMKFINAGYSREVAEKMATQNLLEQFFGSLYGGFIGGAASGGTQLGINMAMSTGDVVNNQIKQNRYYNQQGQNIVENDNLKKLVNDANELEGNRKLRKLAESLAGVDTESLDGENVKNIYKKAGKLYQGVQNVQAEKLANSEKQAFRSAVRQEVESRGIANVDKVTDVIYKARFEGLSSKDRKLYDSVNGREILTKVGNSDSLTEAKTNTINDNYKSFRNTSALPYVKRGETELGRTFDVDVSDRLSDDGKTRTVDGKEITIDQSNPYAVSEDGKTYLNTNEGKVALEDVSFGTESEGLIYEAFAGMDTNVANLAVSRYHGQAPVRTYITGMLQGINVYGKYNFKGVGIDISKSSFLADLSDADQQYALRLGRMLADIETKSKQETVQKSLTGAKDVKWQRKGTVRFEKGVSAKSDIQRKGVELARQLSRITGINIVFFDSTKDTKHKGDNGWFDKRDNSIHLDIHAGNNLEGTIAYTLGHELTHFIEKWSPAKYKAFADFLLEQYGEHGKSVQEMLEVKMAELKTDDVDEAMSELVADACQTMLLDSNAVEKLSLLREQDKTLWDKIREFVNKLLADIKQLYKEYQPDSSEAKALREMEDVVGKISTMFEDAAVDAVENYNASKEVQAKNNGNRQYSLKQFEKDGRRFVEIDQEQDRFKGHARSEYPRIAKKIINEKFNGKVIGIDNRMFVNGRGRDEYVNPSRPIKEDYVYDTKMRASAELDNLLDAGANFRNEADGKDGHIHKSAIGGFDYFDTLFKVGDNYFEAVINIENIKNGKLFKDVTKIKDVTEAIMNSYGQSPKFQFLRTSSMNSISKTSQNATGNIQKSQKKDSDGNTLSEKQVEYFKDSKVRDENGNLIVVHHGTVREFYTFDRQYGNAEGDMGKGFYFTNNTDDVEENYANKDGADLTNKIEHEAELLEYEAEYEDMDHEEIVELLREKYITAEEPITLDCYLDIRNPCYVGSNETYLLEDVYDEYDIDDYEDEEEYYEDVEQIAESYVEDVSFAIAQEGYEVEGVEGILFEAIQDRGITLTVLKEKLNELYLEDEDGNLISNEIARIVVEALGYDGIIDDSVSEKFKGMHLNKDTTHYIVFSSNQAKLTTNQNPTNNADIRYSHRKYSSHVADKLTESEWRYFKKQIGHLKAGNQYEISADGAIMIPVANKLVYTDGKYSNPGISKIVEFVSEYEDEIDRARRAIYAAEKGKSEIEDAYEIVELFLGQGGVNEYAVDDTQTVRKYDRRTERGKSRSDTYHREFLQDRIRNANEVIRKASSEGGEGVSQEQFSKRTLSNREILADALETTIDTSTVAGQYEAKYLKDYKDNIAKLDELEEHLKEVSAELRELSFAKGKRDMDRIRHLRDEKIKTQNRIGIYDKKLLRLEASKPLMDLLSREKEKVKKRYQEQGRERLNNYVSRRNTTALRARVKRIVGELNQLLLKETKEKHVQIGMQKVVAETLDMVNMDTVEADKRVAAYNDKIANETDPQVIEALTEKRDRIASWGDNLSEKMNKLKEEYAKIKNSDDPLTTGFYDEVIADKIETVRESVGDTPLRSMNREQLEDVYDMYKMILTSVRNANKTFKMEKSATIRELGTSTMSEVFKTGSSKNMELKAAQWLKKAGWSYLKPIYAMRLIGSDTLTRLYNNVRAGEDAWYVDVNDAKNFKDSVSKKYGYGKWDFEKQYTYTAKNGKEFSMSLSQMMSLYAYSKRAQAIEHLTIGGIVFDNAIEVKEKKAGVPLTYHVNTADAFNLSEQTISEIAGALTDEQRGFVDEMQAYLSEVMGAKGNEVSLSLYGIKLFKEQFYFPLKSSNDYLYQPNQKDAGEVRVKNMGASKKTVEHANNPVILSDFIDVWASHVNEMSMYHAFVLPLEDFNRVYNYKTPSNEDNNTESVKQYLKNAYGSGVNEYIRQLLTDLNGGARNQGGGTEVPNKFISMFKKNAVFASASVAIQQPSAVIRAMAHINPVYFVASAPHQFNFKQHSADWAECKRYAPIAGIKEMGYFDTGMGQSTVDWIKTEEYEGFRKKVGAFFRDGSFRDEVFSKAPALADEVTWCHIWNAVKREVSAKTDLQGEEYMKRCGERFTEIITLTQVYDSVLARSGMMRSNDLLMKTATSFMAEPTTTMNMVVDSWVHGRRIGGIKGFAFAGKTVGAVLGSIVLNSLLKSFVMAWRDDDDEKTYGEAYWDRVTSDFCDSINPLTYIPFAKDILSIFQGYDVSRADMSLFEDFKGALDTIASDKKTPYQKVTAIIGAVSAFLGVPMKNVERDIRPLLSRILRAQGISLVYKSTSQNSSRFIEYSASGEKNEAAEFYDEWVEEKKIEIAKKRKEDGKKELDDTELEEKAKSGIKSSVSSKFRKVYIEAYKGKDDKAMLEVRKKMLATGLYGTGNDVVKTCQNWVKEYK